MERRSYALAECRTQPETRTLTGVAVVYGAEADFGQFVERFQPGSLTRTLKERAGKLRALYEHDERLLLGTQQANTLRVNSTAKGLEFEIDLPNTTTGNDVLELASRGDIQGMSFAFLPAKDGQKFTRSAGRIYRDLIDVDLFELTVTSHPAYTDSKAQLRSMQDTDKAALEEMIKQTAKPAESRSLLSARLSLLGTSGAVANQ